MAMYRCGSNSGGGVTPTPITPSDSTPAALTANTPVNPTANGYAIESQPQSVTPSASGAAFNSGIVNMSSGGYAYSQKPPVAKSGTFTTNTTAATGYKVTLGFKPKYLCAIRNTSGTGCVAYVDSLSTTMYYRSLSGGSAWRNFESSGNYIAIKSIDDDGFTVYTGTSTYSTVEWTYFALG